MRRTLAAGNWKMNGTPEMLADLAALTTGDTGPQILICPPAPLLTRAADVTLSSPVEIGGQDCHANASGAHTGDIAANMLKDAGATAVIVGHSERRADHLETDAQVR
ncbi:MAG: triose-phosphate isomerase, partial [Ruegeria sp.]